MSRAPLYALTAAISLVVAIMMTVDRAPDLMLAAVAPAHPVQGGPPSTGQVLAGAVEASALNEVEMDLTEEAADRARTTTSVPESTTADSPVAATTSTTTTNATTTSTTTTSTTTTSTTTTSTTATSTTTTSTTTPTTTAPAEESQPAGQFDAAAEAEFASLINSFRSSNGKGALSRNGSLDALAREWAKSMADEGSLNHNLNSVIAPWTSLAENVGTGGSVSGIFGLLKGSSGHASTMLGDFTHLGVGVWREADGTLWTSHVFARS